MLIATAGLCVLMVPVCALLSPYLCRLIAGVALTQAAALEAAREMRRQEWARQKRNLGLMREAE